MDPYAKQLATEAVIVGISTVVGFSLVSAALPTTGILERAFITGAGLHLTFEAVGLNYYYLFHGAASYPKISSCAQNRCRQQSIQGDSPRY